MPRHFTDKDEPDEEREARLAALASVIEGATKNRTERAALIVIAWHETHFARYVHEGRCSDGPRGKYECDSGRARGLFQIHNARGFDVPADDAGQAALALRLFRSHYERCRHFMPDPMIGAFAAYGSGGMCAPTRWAERRATHTKYIGGKL
jgi:hypothetical protein